MTTTYRTTPKGLHLRTGPGTEHPALRVLPQGTAVSLVRVSGEWSCVWTADGSGGWVASRYLEMDAAPWMTVARGELGQTEVAGPKANPRIIEYHGTTTLRATSDEVPWCSSFANWCFLQVGIMGTRMANARSWLTWGKPLAKPMPGCVAVFARGSAPTSGHVGFVSRVEGGRVLVLGGNQGNRVSEVWYQAASALGFRVPS